MNQFLNFSLEGKVALVTGASYGIGFAIASAFAEQGAKVCFNDINQELVDKGMAAYAAKGIKAHGYVCDVTDEPAVQAMVATIAKEVGTIDILVNNAGITRDGLFMRMSAENWDAVINTNLSSAFYVSQPVVKVMMKQRSGAIINMSSVVGVSGNAGQANYSAAKAGLIGLTKTLAKELGSRGIRVNAIAPGFIKTDMTDVLSDKVKENIAASIPMGSMGTTEDVAKAAAFLASDGARYITGQVLRVDGGMAM